MSPRRISAVRAVALALGLVLAASACSADPVATENTADGGDVAATATPSATPSTTATAAAGTAGTCGIFPADNVWHASVAGLPVHPDSASYVDSIGTGKPVHPDFGATPYNGDPIGIPVTTVPAGQPGVKVNFQYASESDPGPYPIPPAVGIEGGRDSDGDRHIILLDQSACRAYELYAAYPNNDGSWRAGSGAVFDLRANALRPAGWTSADAAGLSVLAGLVRYDEVAAGRIDHAIRITVPKTRNAYVWPARHAASTDNSLALPPMGLRLRLKSTVDISGLPAQARVVAAAMQQYGVIVADNGSSWFITGTSDDRWNDDALHALGGLKGSDFEAVDTSSLMVSADSAAVRRP